MKRSIWTFTLLVMATCIMVLSGPGCASRPFSGWFGGDDEEQTGFRWSSGDDSNSKAPRGTGVDPRARDIERRLGYR